MPFPSKNSGVISVSYTHLDVYKRQVLILKILAVKVAAAVFVGFMVDLAFKKKRSGHTIHDICEHEHCDCEHGILRSAIIHTVQIFAFILIISFIMNIVIGLIGRENLSNLILNRPVVGEFIAGAVYYTHLPSQAAF